MIIFSQVSVANAAEHVVCNSKSSKLRAMLVFYGNMNSGDGFAMLTNTDSFGDTSDPDARVFGVFVENKNGLRILNSTKQTETLVVNEGLKQIAIFSKTGELVDQLICGNGLSL